MPRFRHDGHIRTAATEAAETAAGRTALVVAAEPIGITTYDADGDHRRRRCPCGAAAKRGDGEATTKHRRGNKEAKATSYGAACDRGKEAINKRITNTI